VDLHLHRVHFLVIIIIIIAVAQFNNNTHAMFPVNRLLLCPPILR